MADAREGLSEQRAKEDDVIVVTGATGKLGRLVIDALLQRVPAAELAVGVRTPSKTADLAAQGVQVRHADYDRPETLPGAFKPGEKVLLISANEVGKRAAQHLRVIEAARAANVGLLAYTSLLRADRSTLILAEEHRTTEEAIRASGLGAIDQRDPMPITLQRAGDGNADDAGADDDHGGFGVHGGEGSMIGKSRFIGTVRPGDARRTSGIWRRAQADESYLIVFVR